MRVRMRMRVRVRLMVWLGILMQMRRLLRRLRRWRRILMLGSDHGRDIRERLLTQTHVVGRGANECAQRKWRKHRRSSAGMMQLLVQRRVQLMLLVSLMVCGLLRIRTGRNLYGGSGLRLMIADRCH